MTLSNRGREWLRFSDLVINHIEEYTVPQYGDHPHDQATGWSVDSILENIERYKNRWKDNARGKQDNLLALLKIAHYACLAYFKYEAEVTAQPKLDRLDEFILDFVSLYGDDPRELGGAMLDHAKAIRESHERKVQGEGKYVCTRCNNRTSTPKIEDSGPHVKFYCPACLAYIKFAKKEEVDEVMRLITKED